MVRRKDKLKDVAIDLTSAGLVIGVGSGVLGSVGGNPGALTPLAKALPVVGGVAGSGIIVGQLRQLQRTVEGGKRGRKR